MAKYIRKRKKIKEKGKTLTIISAAVIVILVLHFLFSIYSDEPNTSIARSGNIENIINTSGYVIRDETVLESPASGTLSCLVGEGERVSKNTVVAGVYSGGADETTQLKLNSVNEQLLAYGDDMNQEQYKTEDTFSIEFQTRTSIDNIIVAMKDYNMESVLAEKQAIVRILDRYKDEGEITVYEKLLKQKDELEKAIQASRSDIVSPTAGVFSTQIDGYEGYFDTTDISKLTVDVLRKADKKKPVSNDVEVQKGNPVAKVFDNFKWYYAAEVNKNDIIDLRINSAVNIRFTDTSNDLLPATVCAINKSSDDTYALVLSCNRSEELIYHLRKTEAEIVLDTYTGLKVPKSAIHIKGGKRGVYVLRDGVMFFKETEVLYTGDTSVIIQESANSSGVMLYDEVIISGRNLQDGRKL